MSQNDTLENSTTRPTRFQPGNKFGKGRLLGSKNKNKGSYATREQVLRDIQSIYLKAIRKGQLYSALQAKLGLARIAGIARTRKLPEIIKLTDMNEDQLKELIEILAANDPELRLPDTPPEEYHYPLSD